MILNIRPIQY